MTEMVQDVRMKLKRSLVIQPTSATGDSVKSILLLMERNEDKESKDGHDLKTPKESVEENTGGRINCGTTRS